MHNSAILQHLKKHGQQLDSEIAKAIGVELPAVHESLTALAEQGEISKCSVIKYNKGEPVEGILCRLRGYIPPPAPGRKPASN